MEVIDIQAIKDCIVKETIKTIEKALAENSVETTSGLTVIETQKAIDIIRQQLNSVHIQMISGDQNAIGRSMKNDR